jgi:hypothetical protein
MRTLCLLLALLILPMGCSAPAVTLGVTLVYPIEDSDLEMGQPVKFTIRVVDAQGDALDNAQVVITVRDPDGELVAALPAVCGGEGIYRSDYWTVPHLTQEGTWGLLVSAGADRAVGQHAGSFHVQNSASEILMFKYGFYLDPPSLRGTVPFIGAEKGDARNGMIRWGGSLPPNPMHLHPLAYVELHWREGDYGLDSPETVRRFMLEELGDLGLMPIRGLGPFRSFQFKHWGGWHTEGLAYHPEEEMEWVVFYAPEVDKTYALGTTVVLPPGGINPHAALRDSFAVLPEVRAVGVAPEPLPRLLPGPALIGPPLGVAFRGLDQRIVLRWQPAKELTANEYYEVVVTYGYREDTPVVKLVTREVQVAVPEVLYHTPNCSVFDWHVTLMRQIGVDEDGQPEGEPISYESLYWYFWWRYPPGERPFPPLCP